MDVKTWASSIQFYDKTAGSKVRLLVYGESGSGKTTLAATFPEPFFLDSDKGGRTLKDKAIPYLELHRDDRTFDICWDVLTKLEKKEPPFDMIPVKTLVLDSLTSLADFLMIEAMRYPSIGGTPKDPNRFKPEWDHYSLVQSRIKTLVKRAQDLGLNVVATSGVKLERDEIMGTFIGKPSIVGGYRDVVAHDFDEVYFLNVEEQGSTKPPLYVAYTRKYRYFEAKSRDGLANRIVAPTYQTLWPESETK